MQTKMTDSVTRYENARRGFISAVTAHAGLSTFEAEAVLAYYLKHNIAKIRIGANAVDVILGQFLEPEVLKRAAKAAIGQPI